MRSAPVLSPTRTRSLALSALAATFFLTLLLASCGGAVRNPLAEQVGLENDEIEILVRNQNFNQVTVYTARSATFQRLGTVSGNGEARFTTRWTHPDIQLRVKFLAGPDFYTESLPVSPGELLELIIPVR